MDDFTAFCARNFQPFSDNGLQLFMILSWLIKQLKAKGINKL
jgi:hypothetical protein